MSDESTRESVGIFGGSFDPVHLGHLILAEIACDELGLDRVIFIPAHLPPHKLTGRELTPPGSRLQMLRLAIDSNRRFELSTFELDRTAISYTIDTLEHLRAELPETDLVLLIGGDSARDFHTWYRPEEIATLAEVAVWARPGAALPEEIIPGVGYRTIRSPLIEISSTSIRERCRRGHSIRYLTLDSVVEYISTHALYIR